MRYLQMACGFGAAGLLAAAGLGCGKEARCDDGRCGICKGGYCTGYLHIAVLECMYIVNISPLIILGSQKIS